MITKYTMIRAAKKVVAHILVGSLLILLFWVTLNSSTMRGFLGFILFGIVMIWAFVEVMNTWWA